VAPLTASDARAERLLTEGVFRVSGDRQQVTELMAAYKAGA
jgi:hypothetical protein